MIKNASAVWRGGIKDGGGTISTETGVLKEAPYGFKSRFENGPGTNPEELIAAAHAGCFSMALTAILGGEGHTPDNIYTTAKVHLGATTTGPTITRIELETEASVAGISAEDFERLAQKAKAACLVSRALAGVATITLKASLVAQ